jgi:tripartite-type tricarboxylate transporter receptor subunit TctC
MRTRHPSSGVGGLMRLLALLATLALFVAACGGAEDTAGDGGAAEGTEAAAGAADAAAEGTEGGTAASEAGGDAAEIVWEDGVLQPLPDGFPDRPITLIVVDDPGTRDGLYATDMEQAVAEMSPVDITVSYEPHPQGGTLPTLAELMERDGALDGYYPEVTTLVGTPTDLHIEPIEEEWGVGMDDVQFLIATEAQPYVMVQRADAPWGDTFDEWLAYAQENPGELRYISAGVGSGHDITMEWMMEGLGIEAEKVPAAGHQEALAAIGAGQGDFTMTRAELASQNEQAGRVKVIFTSTDTVPEPWTGTEGIASAADYERLGLEDINWGIVLGFMVPDEVPDSHDQWLYELFKAGAMTDGWQDRAESVAGLEIYEEPLTPEEANQLAADVYEFSEPVVRAVGLHHEDN